VVANGEARFVVECKDKPLTLKRALDELDVALDNREAQAAVMVFSSLEVAPRTEPFQWFDRRAVVFDKENLDPHALRLACLWARWLATRAPSEAHDELDTGRVAAIVDGARRGLRAASSVRGSHTQAKKAIDQAGRQLDALLADVESALDELQSLAPPCRLATAVEPSSRR
jgi:hypothetical protein